MPIATPARTQRSLLRPWVLLLLRTRPRHAYELMADLRELGVPQPDPGTLYRLLNDLHEAGLVRSAWEPSRAGPDRRVYRVTAGGTRQLRRDAQALDELAADLRRFAAEWRTLDARLAKRRR